MSARLWPAAANHHARRKRQLKNKRRWRRKAACGLARQLTQPAISSYSSTRNTTFGTSGSKVQVTSLKVTHSATKSRNETFAGPRHRRPRNPTQATAAAESKWRSRPEAEIRAHES